MDDHQLAVSITKVDGTYPEAFPFDPDRKYPEYRGRVSKNAPNQVYQAVRQNFEMLEYDKEHLGKPEWNPLGHIIKPGDSVFIKPNMVTHEYGRKIEKVRGNIFSVITHPAVVRAVADYVAIALKGRGEIIIGDSPSIDANFSKLLERTMLDRLPEFYRKTHGVDCSVLDLRQEWCDDLKYYGYKSKMKPLPGDPKGNTIINLGKDSFFHRMNPLLFQGVFTDRWETMKHHHGQTHEYSVSNSVYQADVYISIPKLKTHHKVGVSLNIKGLVGICTEKNYLVHWRIGFPSWGGDEYPDIEHLEDKLRLLIKHLLNAFAPEQLSWKLSHCLKGGFLGKMLPGSPYRGAWEGNDTCWRMAADLYQVLMSRQRECFSVIDGITAGEKDGPFCPTTRQAGVIISGEDLLLTDCVAVRLMDFDINSVKYLTALIKSLKVDLKQGRVISKDFDVSQFFADNQRTYLKFEPPTLWKNLKRKGRRR